MANNGRLLKVRKDDPRYQEEDEALMRGEDARYVHRKPSKKAKQEYAVRTVIGDSPAAGILSSPEARMVASTAAIAAAPRVVRSVPKLLKAAAQAEIALGPTLSAASGATTWVPGASGLALLAAAGMTSYFTTKWIMERFSKGGRLDAALAAYLKSKRDLAAHLGRPLKPDELKALYQHYLTIVQNIKSGKGWE